MQDNHVGIIYVDSASGISVKFIRKSVILVIASWCKRIIFAIKGMPE